MEQERNKNAHAKESLKCGALFGEPATMKSTLSVRIFKYLFSVLQNGANMPLYLKSQAIYYLGAHTEN